MSGTTLERERVVESLVRLRTIAPQVSDEVRRNIEPVISLLEEAAGPTVSRSEAGRLLGVSHTTINRWIEKGDITTVPTARGRSEIALGQVIRFLQSVEGDRDAGNLTLAQVIHDQRRRASDLDVASLLPRKGDSKGHRKAELRSLAYHRAVARRLDKDIVVDARLRLRRWQEEGRIHPRWADEWTRILVLPLPQIARRISSDSEHARALRQSSPFAGALTEHERRRILEGVEDLTR
jgi:hypothetical protein